jgi:hypothetical protein
MAESVWEKRWDHQCCIPADLDRLVWFLRAGGSWKLYRKALGEKFEEAVAQPFPFRIVLVDIVR